VTASLLDRVHALLTDARVPHALIGAAALAVHGVSRATFDLDLLVTAPHVLTLDMWTPLVNFARVDIRRGDDNDPLAGVVRVSAEGDRDVDVVVGRHVWQRKIIEEASQQELAGGLPVASLAGLVLLKLYAGGPQDLWDVEQLRAIGGRGLDETVSSRIVPLPRAAREAWTRLTTHR
jgi:hypothetical protein